MKVAQLIAAESVAPGIDPRDLAYLLSNLLGCSVPELALRRDEDLSPEQQQLWADYLQRLQEGEPPQYILGGCNFFGLELELTRDVLIPRPETEGLVELALDYLSRGMKVLEIGTGSGAIAVALAKFSQAGWIWATEISPQALQVARRNARLHSCEIIFREADLYPGNEAGFELIVSNPPYVAAQEYAALPDRIRLYEPGQALLAEEGGLACFRRILAAAPNHLKLGGVICFEHGDGQREAILSLAQNAGFTCLSALQDLAGKDRYLILRRTAITVQQ